MHGIYCDSCGEPLLVEGNVRYIARIEVYAAYDPLEITERDLEEATEERMAEIVEELKERDPDELQSEVYQSFKYDLCPRCRGFYVKDPLASARNGEVSDDGGAKGSGGCGNGA